MSVRERVSGAVEIAIDFALGIVSPRRAAIRRHFRRMESDSRYADSVFALLRARGYRAARHKKGDGGGPWRGSMLSPDGETILDGPQLANRTRELHRDDPLASGLLDTFTREIIGTELRARSAAPEQYRQAIDAVWEERRKQLTPTDPGPIGQWLRTLANKFCEDGEAIVKRAIAETGEAVWFETIERERLATPSDATPADPKGSIRAGVERDRHDRVVAYWVMKRHPGEGTSPNTLGAAWSTGIGVTSFDIDFFDRVPVDGLRHVKLADRPGQSRGIGILHAVLQDLRDLDLLMLAALKRTQVAACFALFIESSQAVPDLLEVTADNFGYRLEEDIVPGTIFKLFPGEKITTVVPNFPTPELEPFVILLCRRIGAALGVSWQTVLRDWSTSTYSSARTQILADAPTTHVLRHDLREGALDWIWLTVMEDAVLRGDPRLKGVPREVLGLVMWISDGRPWIDPLKEAQAVQLKLAMRITTLRDECAALGRDWEDQLRQRLVEELRETELREELGLPQASPPPPEKGEPSVTDDGNKEDPQEDAEARGARRRLTAA